MPQSDDCDDPGSTPARGSPPYVPFRGCGAYCGPGWCGGEQKGEVRSLCNFSVAAHGPLDACCKVHDYCCGATAAERAQCNRALIECMQHVSKRDEECLTSSGLPLPTVLFASVMKLVPDWCCGSPCPGSDEDAPLLDFDFVDQTARNFLGPPPINSTNGSIPWYEKHAWQTGELHALLLAWLSVLALALGCYVLVLLHHRRLLSRLRTASGATAERSGDIPPPDEPSTLSFARLGYRTAAGAEILQGISGAVEPGELVALMGPSGSGKTTLLDTLASRRHEGTCDGAIYWNGDVCAPGTAAHQRFRENSAYMLQLAEAFSTGLTVRENLVYSATLRLPAGTPLNALLARVNQVIVSLRMQRIAEVTVGAATGGGISGGQKRKLSLGMELLSTPSLILLDEPTSGLDATSSLEVMSAIRAYCDTGRSAVVTIHQPRHEIVQTFDHMLILYRGAVAFDTSPAAIHTALLRLSESVVWSDGGSMATGNPAELVMDFLQAPCPPELLSEYSGILERESSLSSCATTPSSTSRAASSVRRANEPRRDLETLGDLFTSLRRKHGEEHARLVEERAARMRDRSSGAGDSAGGAPAGAAAAYVVSSRASSPRGRAGFHLGFMKIALLESRYLRETPLGELFSPPLFTVLFGAVFGTLYFQTTQAYSLASLLFVLAKTVRSRATHGALPHRAPPPRCTAESMHRVWHRSATPGRCPSSAASSHPPARSTMWRPSRVSTARHTRWRSGTSPSPSSRAPRCCSCT